MRPRFTDAERAAVASGMTAAQRNALLEQQQMALVANSKVLQRHSVAQLREEIKLVLKYYHGSFLDAQCRQKMSDDIEAAARRWRDCHKEIWRNKDGTPYYGEDLKAYLRYDRGEMIYGENQALSRMSHGEADVVYVIDKPIGHDCIKNIAMVDNLTNPSTTSEPVVTHPPDSFVHLEMHKGISTVLEDGRIPISFTVNGEINHRIGWLTGYTPAAPGSKVRITIEVITEGKS